MELPPLPIIELTDELWESLGIKPMSKKEFKEIKQKFNRKITEKNLCPISPKLSKMELLLHNIINELSRISINEGMDDTLHDAKFHNLASCRYSIEDAQYAIDEYKKKDYEKHSYLFYYGLLQAFQNQQDSLKSLFTLIFNKKEKEYSIINMYPNFKHIRTIRNNVLHSTENTERGKPSIIKNYVISRTTMTKKTFTLIEETKDNDTIKEPNIQVIDLYSLIELQEKTVLYELKSYLKILQKSRSFSEVENFCPL
jgi:hypothetical protein